MAEKKLQDLISYIGDSIYDFIGSEFDKSARSYFDSEKLTDETDEDFRERFEDEYSFNTWIEMLKNDKSFKEDFEALVKYVAWNRDTEV